MLHLNFWRAYVPLSLAVCLLALAAIPAGAQNSTTMGVSQVPHASSLIHVSHCEAKLNVMQSGGFVGYAPGFYGAGYWGDVYGARYYSPPVTTTSPELAIHYKNISGQTMSKIEFGLVANGILKAEVHDVGTFSTGAEIKHKFAVPTSTFPIGTGLPQCVPLRITFENGTHWRNPKLPPKNEEIYYHP